LINEAVEFPAVEITGEAQGVDSLLAAHATLELPSR
jgi:hypothetical protein